MILGHRPRKKFDPSSSWKFRQPPGYYSQVITDPRFNHALRRNAFANVPKIDWKDLPK